MEKIRNSVFETNSSSTHSISIDENAKTLTTIQKDDDGNITFYGDEFGWGYEKINDALTKANYCVQYLEYQDDTKVDMFKEVIREITGCNEVFLEPEGYLDHQSSDVADEAFLSKDTLISFIFNPNSELIIDNDNN